jgi:hypothetical protein
MTGHSNGTRRASQPWLALNESVIPPSIYLDQTYRSITQRAFVGKLLSFHFVAVFAMAFELRDKGFDMLAHCLDSLVAIVSKSPTGYAMLASDVAKKIRKPCVRVL